MPLAWPVSNKSRACSTGGPAAALSAVGRVSEHIGPSRRQVAARGDARLLWAIELLVDNIEIRTERIGDLGPQRLDLSAELGVA